MEMIKAALYHKPQVDGQNDDLDGEDGENMKKDIPEADSKKMLLVTLCLLHNVVVSWEG